MKIEKDQSIKYKTKEHISLDNSVAEETNDRAETQTELQANLDALAELKKSCSGPVMTYERRVARREEEMADLKDSLASLESLAGTDEAEIPAVAEDEPAAESEPAAEPAAETPPAAEGPTAAESPTADESPTAEESPTADESPTALIQTQHFMSVRRH